MVRALERPLDAHFLQIVGELFAAIQAHDVSLPIGHASPNYRRDRPRQAAVGTSEQQVEQRIDHCGRPALRAAPRVQHSITAAYGHEPPAAAVLHLHDRDWVYVPEGADSSAGGKWSAVRCFPAICRRSFRDYSPVKRWSRMRWCSRTRKFTSRTAIERA
jgi:hypothetical protein